MSDDGQQRPPEPPERPQEPPEYNVYRSRRGLFSRLRGAEIPSFKKELPWRRKSDGDQAGEPKPPKPRRPVNGRRIAKWLGIAIVGWIAISFLSFAVSAQLQ